jgi:hypothetical protein
MKINTLLQIDPDHVNFEQIAPNEFNRYCNLVPKFAFASGDAIGIIRVWNLDFKESVFSLKHDPTSKFGALPVREMV